MKNAPLAILLFGMPFYSAQASPFLEQVSRIGPNRYHIVMQTQAQAAQQPLWDVLTDYDHHAQILPYMTQSHILERHNHTLIVQQEGQIHVLFWAFTMRITQKIQEHPPETMSFHTIAGDFKTLEGSWHLSATHIHQTTIGCDFVVEPTRHVPEWAVRMVTQRYLHRMIKSLVQHAEKESIRS